MEQHNEIGTEGIVVASFFAACIAGCIAVLVGMCLRDKRAQKKFENLKRAKTLRTAKREEQANLMAGGRI
jgi:phosphate/sulfate permease